MPFARPTLVQLRNIAQQDVSSADLGGTDGLLRRSVLRVLGWTMAGFSYLHYGYQDWIARMAVPWTAEDEFAAAWGALKGIYRKAATAAQGSATFTGVAGTVIPLGTGITRSDGVLYGSTAEVVVDAGGRAVVPFTASSAGADASVVAGQLFYLSGSITGVDATSIASAPVQAGAAIEDPADFKSRYLEAYAAPPNGGSANDYRQWAKEVPGVTRAWVNPNGAGSGTVVVYTMWDDAEAAAGGFPQGTDGVASDEPRDIAATGDQLVVADHISPVRPVTALVYSVAPRPAAIDFVLANLSPSTTAILSGIDTALGELFLRRGDPLGGTIYPSEWDAALSSVSGISHFTVVSPSGPLTLPVGSLPVLGTVTRQ